MQQPEQARGAGAGAVHLPRTAARNSFSGNSNNNQLHPHGAGQHHRVGTRQPPNLQVGGSSASNAMPKVPQIGNGRLSDNVKKAEVVYASPRKKSSIYMSPRKG